MFDDTLTINGDALRESLHTWQAEQEALEGEWNESLAALVAFQSHLDNWQRELAAEREVLYAERDAFERDQSAAATERDDSDAQVTAELATARSKVSELSEQLLTRTEELRALDQNRAELSTEIEAARAHARQLAGDIEEQKRAIETERKSWAEQMACLRGLLDQRAAAPEANEARPVRSPTAEANAPAASRPKKTAAGEQASANNPVLGSIMEQFGKLRQQRASDRQSGRNAR